MTNVYKQTILPIVEYADLLIESGPAERVTQLQNLENRSIRIIDNKSNPNLDVNRLSSLYRLAQLKERRAEHLCVVMYRVSKKQELLENHRPAVNLRSKNKIKFKVRRRDKEKYLKSPLSRGIVLWDRIPEEIQKSTTKVKFKKHIKSLLVDLMKPVPR